MDSTCFETRVPKHVESIVSRAIRSVRASRAAEVDSSPLVVPSSSSFSDSDNEMMKMDDVNSPALDRLMRSCATSVLSNEVIAIGDVRRRINRKTSAPEIGRIYKICGLDSDDLVPERVPALTPKEVQDLVGKKRQAKAPPVRD